MRRTRETVVGSGIEAAVVGIGPGVDAGVGSACRRNGTSGRSGKMPKFCMFDTASPLEMWLVAGVEVGVDRARCRGGTCSCGGKEHFTPKAETLQTRAVPGVRLLRSVPLHTV